MDERAALYTLASRLLGRQYLYYVPDHNPDAQHADIVVGALPDDLPVSIPLPDDAEVIGSVRDRSAPSNVFHWPQTQVLFDTPLSVEQVRDFYRTRLAAAGWTQAKQARRPHGGFNPDFEWTLVRDLYCRGERGPALRVNVHPQQAAATQVHLELDTSTRHSPCARVAVPHSLDFLPPLRLPATASYVHGGWGGGGGSSDTAHSEMTIHADLDLTALRAHFDAQLEQAGWSRQGGKKEGALAWSTWTFVNAAGESWHGELHVAQRPGRPQQYLLHLEAEWARQR